ncbi:hypothetical protein Lal_00016304 [Lupinus albus]|nr:hypothetical protein Lal_00016304 [Lupinus albus]
MSSLYDAFKLPWLHVTFKSKDKDPTFSAKAIKAMVNFHLFSQALNAIFKHGQAIRQAAHIFSST